MKSFNTCTVCIPKKHYMVDISDKVDRIIREYIEPGKYFTINRARQYGKTTTLNALYDALQDRYCVLFLSFEWAGSLFFQTEHSMAKGFVQLVEEQLLLDGYPAELIEQWRLPIDPGAPFFDLNRRIRSLCQSLEKPVILFIDEVDKAANHTVFLQFLGLLRDKYIRRERGKDVTFHSVVLAGVYDIKSLKLKLRPDEEARFNSPWNVAAPFDVDLSFSKEDIEKMLLEYRADHALSFDASRFAHQLFDYTSGYPFLVSRLCELLDTTVAKELSSLSEAWTNEGLQCAIRLLLVEQNTLFEDMTKKLQEHKELKQFVARVIFNRESPSYLNTDPLIQMGVMFGWFGQRGLRVAISNRIFETLLSNQLIHEHLYDEISSVAGREIYQLKTPTELCMDTILQRFAAHYASIYADRSAAFLEDQGRLIFLTYLRPIINGSANYYLEAMTMDNTRTDIVVDYHGKQYIIELKIWHGESYQEAGREQLLGYMDRYGVQKGWLLSFCFNRNKKELLGTRELHFDGKTILETVV